MVFQPERRFQLLVVELNTSLGSPHVHDSRALLRNWPFMIRTLQPKINTLEGGRERVPPEKCWIGIRFVMEWMVLTSTKIIYWWAKHQKESGRPAVTKAERVIRFCGRWGDSTMPFAVELSPPVDWTFIWRVSIIYWLNSVDLASSPPSSTRTTMQGYPCRCVRQKKYSSRSKGGRLWRQLKLNFIREVASTMLRDAMKPRIDRVFQKVKSTWNRVPIGSSVVSTHGPLANFVAPIMSQTGQRPGKGASFFGWPLGSWMWPTLIICWSAPTDFCPYLRCRIRVQRGYEGLKLMLWHLGGREMWHARWTRFQWRPPG